MLPEVDPDDDSTWRWVLRHRLFDPERRQRREVVVAAYDCAADFQGAAAYSRLIRAEIDAGQRDPQEHVGGVIWNPGFHAEQARRLVGDAVRHGGDPRPLVEDGRLPPRVFVAG